LNNNNNNKKKKKKKKLCSGTKPNKNFGEMDIKSLAGIKIIALHFIQAFSSSCIMDIRLTEDIFDELLRDIFRKVRALQANFGMQSSRGHNHTLPHTIKLIIH